MNKLMNIALEVLLWILGIIAAGLLILLIIMSLGGIPHLEMDEAKYEMNINGSVDTVDIQSYRNGFIVMDNGIPVNFEMYDISKYEAEGTVYTMCYTKKKDFVLINKDIIITFQKL